MSETIQPTPSVKPAQQPQQQRPVLQEKPKRKPTMVAVASTSEGNVLRLALCNDGTIWSMTGSGEWTQLPSIPEA